VLIILYGYNTEYLVHTHARALTHQRFNFTFKVYSVRIASKTHQRFNFTFKVYSVRIASKNLWRKTVHVMCSIWRYNKVIPLQQNIFLWKNQHTEKTVTDPWCKRGSWCSSL